MSRHQHRLAQSTALALLAGVAATASASGSATPPLPGHYWTFEQEMNGAFEDIIGDRIGENHGAATTLGVYGYAVAGNGAESIWTDYAPQLHAGDSFTATLWVMLPDGGLADAEYIFGCEETGDTELSLSAYPSTNRMKIYFRQDGGGIADEAWCPLEYFNDGEWHHIVGMRDADLGLVQMWVDGVLRHSVTMTTGDVNVSNPQTLDLLGSLHGSQGHILEFSGAIDDVRFYDRALTAEEIRSLCPHVCRGDFNADGTINTLDVLAFLNAWTAGCP